MAPSTSALATRISTQWVFRRRPATVTASLAFGNSPVGDTVTKNITVKNTGSTNALFIGSVTSNDPEFAATGHQLPRADLRMTLTCTITIGFTPSALGARSATLSVNDNSANQPAARGAHRHRHDHNERHARQLRLRQRKGRLQGGQGDRRAQLSDQLGLAGRGIQRAQRRRFLDHRRHLHVDAGGKGQFVH